MILLTENGIPPQVAARLTPAELQATLDVTWNGPQLNNDNGPDYFQQWSVRQPQALSPCMQKLQTVLAGIEGAYTTFGATFTGLNNLMLRGDALGGNDTSLRDTPDLHPDDGMGIENFRQNKLMIRAICVTSMPTTFLDLTGIDGGIEIMAAQRRQKPPRQDGTGGGKYYDPALLERFRDQVRVFEIGDIVIFDGNTPHLPGRSAQPHWRALQLGYQDTTLPDGWRKQIAAGIGPRLQL